MDINDFLEILTSPQLWPLFLTFLGGYVMMRVMFDKGRLEGFSELEKVLVSFGVGALFEYFMFYPIITLATFWWPKLGENAYMISVFLFCTASAIGLFYRIHGYTESQIISGAKRILIVVFICLSVFDVFSVIVGLTATFWYEPYKSHIIADSWRTFIGLNILSIFLASVAYIFLWLYLFKPLLEEELEIKLPQFTRRTFAIGVAMLAIIVMLALVVVPLDRYANVFTPRMEIGEEIYSSKMMFEGSPVVLFIHAERISQYNISRTYRFYALMERPYNISLPKISLLSSLYITNPSNTSFIKGEGNPFVSFSESWKQIYIYVPENVSYSFSLKESSISESKVVGVTVEFANLTGKTSFLTNLTYWQEIPKIASVEIENLDPKYIDLGNGTWMEGHTFMISNNSSRFLYISALEFDRFAFGIVHRNSTRVYRNGELIPYAELVWQTRLSLGMYLNPGYSMNMTVSFVVDEVS